MLVAQIDAPISHDSWLVISCRATEWEDLFQLLSTMAYCCCYFTTATTMSLLFSIVSTSTATALSSVEILQPQVRGCSSVEARQRSG